MRTFLLFAITLVISACAPKRETTQPERHYQLSGKVIALNAKDQTATIDAGAITNFMEAMTMEYPIKSRTEFNALHVGDKVKATVDVREDSYDLSNVKKQK